MKFGQHGPQEHVSHKNFLKNAFSRILFQRQTRHNSVRGRSSYYSTLLTIIIVYNEPLTGRQSQANSSVLWS